MLRRTALAVLMVALAAPLAVSQSAASAPPTPRAAQAGTWSPVVQLDREEILLDKDAIAIAGSGDVTAVWGCSTAEKACTSDLPSGGLWTTRDYLGRGHAPAVVVDGAGVVTAAWSGPRGVVVARKRPGHDWTAPVVLDRLGWSPDLVVGPSGRVTVAWMQRTKGQKVRIRSAARLLTGAWTAPVNVTARVGAVDPQLGVDGNGVVTLVYAVGSLTREKPGVLTSQRWAGGTGWSAPVVLADRSVSEVLATDPAGDAVVVFLRTSFGRLHTVAREAGRSWSAPRAISPAGVDYLGVFSAAFDVDRSVLVAWARDTGRVDLVHRPLGGAWSPPSQLAAKGGWWAEVRTSASGDAFVAWANQGVYGRYRASGGAWGPRQTISTKGNWPVEDFSLAMSQAGDVVVLWSREETFTLKARVLTVS